MSLNKAILAGVVVIAHIILGVFFWNAFLVSAGFILLTVAADKLVEGASAMAIKFGVTPMLIGLTIVAFGTSLPELVISCQASFDNDPDIAVGNVVGSNIINAALILGVAALIRPLTCTRGVVRRDVPIMIGTAVLTWFMGRDLVISRPEALLLFALFILYNVASYYWAKADVAAEQKASGTPPTPQEVQGNATAADSSTRPDASPVSSPASGPIPAASASTTEPGPGAEKNQTVPGLDPNDPAAAALAEVLQAPTTLRQDFILLIFGLIGLAAGAKILLVGAVNIAQSMNISKEIIGLTLVAVGTSLPELATSMVGSWRGQSDIIIGNIVGSNIFNILGILGAAGMILPLQVTPSMQGMSVPLMVVVSLGCLPIMRTGMRIIRLEGLILLASYVGYLYMLLQTK